MPWTGELILTFLGDAGVCGRVDILSAASPSLLICGQLFRRPEEVCGRRIMSRGMRRVLCSGRTRFRIAEAVTKARPGGTSSRADEWRTPPVRSDPKLGANDLMMAKPRPTACLGVRDRTGTSAQQRGSCEGRGCRTRMSMGTRMRRGRKAREGSTCELPARK